MRFKEAYEVARAGLRKFKIGFTISENLLDEQYDPIIELLGLRYVKKPVTISWDTVAEQLDYIITPTNFPANSPQTTLVRVENKWIPFVPKPGAPIPNSNISNEDQEYEIGYYYDKEITTGVITGATSANPIVITDVAHGLSTADWVIISEIVGLLSAAGALSAVNGNRFSITKVDADSFSIAVDGSAYAVNYTSGGVWIQDNNKIHLTKSLGAGDTLYLDYFARPEPRSSLVSRIDLPQQLITASIQRLMGVILDLDGQLKFGSGFKGKAKSIEKEWSEMNYMRDPGPSMISPPMVDLT